MLMGSQPFETKAECFLQGLLLFPWKFPCGFPREKRPEEMATAPRPCQHLGLSQAGFPASRTDAHHRGLLFEEEVSDLHILPRSSLMFKAPC